LQQLFTSDSKPPISIASIAHLDDAGRLCIGSLALSEPSAWIR